LDRAASIGSIYPDAANLKMTKCCLRRMPEEIMPPDADERDAWIDGG